jgi:zinc protease
MSQIQTLKITGVFFLSLMLLFSSCVKEKPNELSTVTLAVPDNPMIHLRIILDVGSAYDPEGKEGLGALTFSMLADGGSQALSYKEITDKFYPMAASVGMSMDKEMTAFYGTIHKDNLDAYYAVFKDMLINPGFREEDFIRLKTNQLNFLDKTLVNNMDEQFGKEILNLKMYAGHPYGHHEYGTVESVKGLTLDDVKAYYKEHFVSGNITVGVAGGYPDGFPDKVAEDFRTLPDDYTPSLILPPQEMPEGLEIVMAEKNTPATAISLGFPLPITRADDDFFALWIAGSHFGEHRQHLSHLFQKIREERGQNYGDYAYIEHFIQGRDKFPAPNHVRPQQYFSIWIRPLANRNRHFVIRQTLRELKLLIENGIPEDRLELVKKYLVNYTKLYTQTLGERLGWKIDSQYYGYEDFLAEARRRIPEITREQVNEAIRKYLNYENLYIAVITENAQALKEDLIANTPSPITYANPNMPEEILTEDLIIQEYPLDVTEENVHIAPAEEFFQKTGLPIKK